VLGKSIVLFGLAVILAMGMYPPWTQTFALPGRITRHENAYGWLLNPPYPLDAPVHEVWDVKIDALRLGLQWTLVSIAVGGLLWTFKPRRKVRVLRADAEFQRVIDTGGPSGESK